MLLKIHLTEENFGAIYRGFRSSLVLTDLHTGKAKKEVLDVRGMPVEFGFKGVSEKLLDNTHLQRILSEKEGRKIRK